MNMTKHPLRITADAFRQAFARNGFTLYDNGDYPELEKTEVNVKIFNNPAAAFKPILLMDGQYAMRTQLLPFVLPKMRKSVPPAPAMPGPGMPPPGMPAHGMQPAGPQGKGMPAPGMRPPGMPDFAMHAPGEIFGVSCGKVFDGNDAAHPAHLLLEGAVASGMNFYDYNVLWKRIVRAALGIGYESELVSVDEAKKKADLASWGTNAMKETTLEEQLTWKISVTDPDGAEFILGYTGTMTWLGKALLGSDRPNCYAFSIDLDAAACRWLGIENREDLFDNRSEMLIGWRNSQVSASEAFEDRCRDVLRTMGYDEAFGPKLYPDGIYKKMNMIQDEWDLNNKGVLLKEPLGENVGLPTVLTPAIEQIISEKWANGEPSAKAFEISHIFVPQSGSAPIEKLALSFASYGEDVTLKSFTAEVDKFLTKIGNKNHFFLPNNMAIAYQFNECRLILDEKMQYLGGNFGGISSKAEANFGIGIHAYMANLELMPLENKANEEYGYIAPELR